MKINNSNDRVVPEFKKYYGIGNFKVVGINSSLVELEALGYPFTKEPEYKVNISGKDYSKLVFYVHNAELDIKTKLEFLLSDREVEFSTGSKKYVNDLAQSSIGDSLETCLGRTNKSGVAFFKNVNARAAKEGEVELLEFLVAWFNIKNFVSATEHAKGIKPDTVEINFANLLKGDVSELKRYHTMAKDNEVKLMVEVNNGYMNIYNRYFDRATSSLSNFAKYLNKQIEAGYAPKGEFVCADLTEYTGTVPSTPTPDADVVNTPEAVF